MIYSAISTQYRRVTDRQTDRQTDRYMDVLPQHSLHLCRALCSKNSPV